MTLPCSFSRSTLVTWAPGKRVLIDDITGPGTSDWEIFLFFPDEAHAETVTRARAATDETARRVTMERMGTSCLGWDDLGPIDERVPMAMASHQRFQTR